VGERRRANIGFTLVEMLIILVSAGIILAMGLPKILKDRGVSEATRMSSLNSCRAAIQEFHGDTGLYPASLSDLATDRAPTEGVDSAGHVHPIEVRHWQGPYMDAVPLDPVTLNLYSYASTPPHVGLVKPPEP